MQGGLFGDMNNREDSFFNLINLAAFLIGYQNLRENEEQSAYNDVQAANDRQAEYLLEQIGRKFDEQNRMLKEIILALKEEK